MAEQVQNKCPIHVDEIWVFAQLQEKRFKFFWMDIGVPDAKLGFYTKYEAANASDICRHNPDGIGVRGDGYIVVAGQKHFPLHEVASPSVENPCGL